MILLLSVLMRVGVVGEFPACGETASEAEEGTKWNVATS